MLFKQNLCAIYFYSLKLKVSSYTLQSQTLITTNDAAVNMDESCKISGNGDIYGLGVRLGIYFQWVTSILVENVYRAEIPATRAAGNCYQIAMLAGLIRISQYPSDEALALEGYIVLLFCFVGVWASSIGLQGRFSKRSGPGEPPSERRNRNQAVGFGPLISMSLSTTTSAYGTWFLFSGIHHMARKEEKCDEIIFFFSRVKLFGWALIILKVFFVMSLVGSGVLLMYQLYSITQNLGMLLEEWKQAPTQTVLSQSSTSIEGGKVTVGALKLIESILAMTVFVVSIELTLMWNHIGDVYSCNSFSQVFSLVVGASVCVRIAMDLCRMLAVRDIELAVKW
jgi:hypothetical protein